MPNAEHNERRIKRYKRKIEQLKRVAAATRTHYGDIVAKHIAAERNLQQELDAMKEAAIQDRFKLQEYENQVALQHRQAAELRSTIAVLDEINARHGSAREQLMEQLGQARSEVIRLHGRMERLKESRWRKIQTFLGNL